MIERQYGCGHQLDWPVLVLNRLWQAVNVCPARRAVALLYSGNAQVVDEIDGAFSLHTFNDWCAAPLFNSREALIRSITLSVRCPRTIVLGRFDRLPNKEVRYSRTNVFARDHHVCQYCRKCHDRKNLNIDHVVPRQRGGKTIWTNVVCCCIDCNRRKGNHTPDEAKMPLLREPKKPRWQPFLEIQFNQFYGEAWHNFLDMPNRKAELGDFK